MSEPGAMTAGDWSGSRGARWVAQQAGMEATLAPVDGPLLRALRLEGPCRIVDVGCGSGATSLELLRRAPAGSVVHGVDISPDMIEAARARVAPGERRLAFTVGDATTAPAPGGEPCDRLVSRFGTMFFADPPAAFANLAGWLAPGGRLALAVWGPLADNAWMATIRAAVAEVVEVPRPDPAAPGPFRYGQVDLLLELLRGAGLVDLAVEEWRGQLPLGGSRSPADAARFALASFSTFAELLAQAGPAAAEAAQRGLTARLAPHERDGAVRLDARVHIVTAARASTS